MENTDDFNKTTKAGENCAAFDANAAEEFIPVEILPDETADETEASGLSAEVKEAIRTVVLGAPPFVKDALGVIAAEDAFIVKEIIRVIVETPFAADDTENDGAPTSENNVTEAVFDAAERFDAEHTAEDEFTDEIPIGVGHLTAPVSRKTYSSSLRRPDQKKETASAAKNK